MATTSTHFNHYFAQNEQSLIQDMIDESIFISGLEVAYIPRTQDNVDFLFNEDPTQSYTSFKHVAVYPVFVDGFDGQELMSMFGDEFQKSGTFVVSKRKFGEIFPEFIRPREGDLIYMPVVNAILEIKHVDSESPFFEKGKQYVYELKTEQFEYSYEEISTGNIDIDTELDNLEVLNPDTNIEDEYGDNDDLAQAADVDFDPANPFGVR